MNRNFKYIMVASILSLLFYILYYSFPIEQKTASVHEELIQQKLNEGVYFSSSIAARSGVTLDGCTIIISRNMECRVPVAVKRYQQIINLREIDSIIRLNSMIGEQSLFQFNLNPSIVERIGKFNELKGISRNLLDKMNIETRNIAQRCDGEEYHSNNGFNSMIFIQNSKGENLFNLLNEYLLNKCSH